VAAKHYFHARPGGDKHDMRREKGPVIVTCGASSVSNSVFCYPYHPYPPVARFSVPVCAPPPGVRMLPCPNTARRQ
jgi:hypothetical protein